MRVWPILYWFLAGAALGVGLAGLASGGLILLVFGVVMAFVARYWMKTEGVWALLVGFGALPAILFTYAIVTQLGPVPVAWYVEAVGFAAVALGGLVWGIVTRKPDRRKPAA